MQVFISWSGVKSHKVAEALHEWLPMVIHTVQPYLSTDMDLGVRWSQDIGQRLQDTDFGILCITQENQHKPWLNFEAGALAKKLETSFVPGLLIDLRVADVTGPLAQFQNTPIDRASIAKLVHQINHISTPVTPDRTLDANLAKWWPDLDEKLTEIAEEEADDPWTEPPRTTEDLLNEVVELTRDMQRALLSPRPAMLHGYDVSPHQRDLRLRHEQERVMALLDKYEIPPFVTEVATDEAGIRLTIMHIPDEKLTAEVKDEFIRAAFTRGWGSIRWVDSTASYDRYNEPDDPFTQDDDDPGGYNV